MSDISDILPLSPMQAGMFFHALYEPESDAYVMQTVVKVREPVNGRALRQAWQQIIDQTDNFRTSFHWEELSQPIQIVRRHVTMPWQELDWRHEGHDLHAWLEEDRAQGFPWTKAPQMRVTLIRWDAQYCYLVWTRHHILSDGWSSPLVLQRLLSLYDAAHRGTAMTLPPTPPYKAYLTWLARQDKQKAEQFWRAELAGFEAPTPLLVDKLHLVDKSPSTQLTENSFSLPATWFDTLQAKIREQRVTLNTVIQGVWAVLLNHYSREEEVLFGTTTSGRSPTLPHVEEMIGLFINTLPTRIQVDRQANLWTWLRQLQERQSERDSYSYIPLVDIQRWSEISAGTSLFDSIVVYENYPLPTEFSTRDELPLVVEEVFSCEKTHYPLTVVVYFADTLHFRISYDSQLFASTTIERMAGHLQTLLRSVITATTVGELPVLTEAERHQLLVTWKEISAPYTLNQTVIDIFEQQAERTPDAVAVIFEEVQLSYAELNAQANQLAHFLRDQGVRPDTLVGICVERSIEMVIGILGILKAGGAYLPLDVSYPTERLAYMVQNAQLEWLITTSSLRTQLPAISGHVYDVESLLESLNNQGLDQRNPVSRVTLDNLFYVMYTSGSTGQPKGIAMHHEPISNLIEWQRRQFLPNIPQRTLQFSPIGFDASCHEMFTTFGEGGAICLIPEETRRDPYQLLEWIERFQINRLFMPAVALQMLAEATVVADRYPTSLQVIITAGEQLRTTPTLVEFIQRSACRLENHYGPTETHVVTVYKLPEQTDDWRALPPIGRPLPNCTTYILDQQGQPTPIGVAGELYLGGRCLAQGYLNRADLTAERFIDNPFGEGRLYKTGDVCRYLPDGNIEFLGRTDHQVKIRGFRVELGEIEAVLSQHPAVSETVVLAREDETKQKRLVAYIVEHDQVEHDKVEHDKIEDDKIEQNAAAVMQEGHLVSPSALRRYLSEKLPDYMVPAAFITLDAMPLTSSGKINRKALPAPDSTSLAIDTVFVPPRTALEAQIAEIWRDVLRVEQVGIHDDFFALGGHSLLATQVVSRLKKEFAVNIPLKSIFSQPTVEQLALQIANLQKMKAIQKRTVQSEEIEEGEI